MTGKKQVLFLLLLTACGDQSEKAKERGEAITRLHNEDHFTPPSPQMVVRSPYPWEKDRVAHLPKITKEFFRCKGSSLNPDQIIERGDKVSHISDCGGTDCHSLQLRNGKEFIYPILLDLINYLQAQTGKRVVVTAGHRCPQHNTYVDPSIYNQTSKHMIGAEASFYIQGMEYQPETVVDLLIKYYEENPDFNFHTFQRYEKPNTNVSIQPWFNKEIFIKLFQVDEGRNLDNRHPYPYISIQVRWDRDLDERVSYTWEMANKNYLRK